MKEKRTSVNEKSLISYQTEFDENYPKGFIKFCEEKSIPKSNNYNIVTYCNNHNHEFDWRTVRIGRNMACIA